MDSGGGGVGAGGAGGPEAGGFGRAEFEVAGLGATEHPTAIIVSDASNITRHELRSKGKLLKLGQVFLTVTFASFVYNPATLLSSFKLFNLEVCCFH